MVGFLFRLSSLIVVSSGLIFGSDWSEMNTGLADTNIRVLAIDPLNPAIVYAGTPGGLYKSTDGMLWNNIGPQRVVSLAIDFINPNNLYAGTEGNGDRPLFKSTDGGLTWSNRESEGL
jgi:hypothetical protein